MTDIDSIVACVGDAMHEWCDSMSVIDNEDIAEICDEIRNRLEKLKKDETE